MTTTSSSTGDATGVTRYGILTRLYTGTGAFDIVGRRKMWYVISLILVAICIGSMSIKQFNLGIDFVGGTRLQFPVAAADGRTITTEDTEQLFRDTLGKEPVTTQTVGQGDNATVLLRSDTLSQEEVVKLKTAIAEDLKPLASDGQPTLAAISDSAVSASWGGEISQKALVALLHDVILTAGIYSIIGFEVSPATVIGLLTILGFSLYDTVVVFDKVQENTRGLLGLTRRTYGEAANLAVNQTLMRSINTSLIAVLPVIGLLVIGVGLLGVGTLKDLALVQMVGIVSGAYSSIVLATPIVVDLTMRRPAYQQQYQRVMQRRDNLARKAAGGGDAAQDAASENEESLVAEQRRERAMAAAAGVPARVGKAGTQPRSRPSGKTGRPSGKKRRV